MYIERKKHEAATEFVLHLAGEEYDTIFWALYEYSNKLIGTLNEAKGKSATAAEDFMFCGTTLGDCGTMMFEMQENNREHGDTRW
jgi:hypothetical protein